MKIEFKAEMEVKDIMTNMVGIVSKVYDTVLDVKFNDWTTAKYWLDGTYTRGHVQRLYPVDYKVEIKVTPPKYEYLVVYKARDGYDITESYYLSEEEFEYECDALTFVSLIKDSKRVRQEAK